MSYEVQSFLFFFDQLIFNGLFADLFVNAELLFILFEEGHSLTFEKDFELIDFLSVIVIVFDSLFGESLDFGIFVSDSLMKGCILLD